MKDDVPQIRLIPIFEGTGDHRSSFRAEGIAPFATGTLITWADASTTTLTWDAGNLLTQVVDTKLAERIEPQGDQVGTRIEATAGVVMVWGWPWPSWCQQRTRQREVTA